MGENDLRQLQRLGIDVWVSPRRARELIAAGHANPLNHGEGTRTVQSQTSRPGTARPWVRRDTTKASTTITGEDTKTRDQRSSHTVPATIRKKSPEESVPKPFSVHLRVFLYGSVAMMIEYSEKYFDVLVLDILRALSGFEDHQLNELHFKFPLIDLSQNEKTISTLAGAQEGFQAWFDQRSPDNEALLVIGTPVKDTVARLSRRTSHTIYIDALPQSRAGKQRLWNQIKNLNV